MKLMTFHNGSGVPRVGALLKEGTHLADLQATAQRAEGTETPHLRTMLDFLEAGQQAHDQAARLLEKAPEYGTTLPLASVRLLAPVPRPLSIRDCIGFTGHVVNSVRNIVAGGRLKKLDLAMERLSGWTLAKAMLPTAWERPLYYFSSVCGVVGSGADIPIPAYTHAIDYELEWSACIGKRGVNIRAGNARAHIAGYTIFNDVSARDVQMQEMKGRLGVQKGKSFDACNVMGPYLVTADEIPDPYALEMWATVNGEEWSRGSTRQQDWRFEEMIEFISRSETLYPGEFICSGTVPTGCGLELGRQLKADDVIELHVEKIGSLKNRFVAQPHQPLPLRSRKARPAQRS